MPKITRSGGPLWASRPPPPLPLLRCEHRPAEVRARRRDSGQLGCVPVWPGRRDIARGVRPPAPDGLHPGLATELPARTDRRHCPPLQGPPPPHSCGTVCRAGAMDVLTLQVAAGAPASS